ncbi:cobalt transporter [Methylobacterium sp. WL9]|nr:cobalt transporter [Methylobacterium sp. WL9]
MPPAGRPEFFKMSTTTATVQTAAAASESTRAIVIAALLGLGLVFMTGFAPAMALHNAAHDFRHTQNFPCH